MSIAVLSFKALADRILSGMRVVPVDDGQGNVSEMVFVPRFTVPANSLLDETWPSADLDLGGFLVDRYSCSHPDATQSTRGIGTNPTVAADSSSDIAVSRAAVVPWTDIAIENAAKACANRKVFGGQSCHLLAPREYAALVLLLWLLGAPVRGNTTSGRDVRDDNVWANNGVPDPIAPGRCLVGTGPASWSSTQQAAAMADLLGNVWEMLDMPVEDTVYTHRMAAALDDAAGIVAGDTSIDLDGVQDLSNWPASNGCIYIHPEGSNAEETVEYGTLTDNGNGTITLSGCSRGANGSTAGPHSDDAVVECLVEKCIMPGGARGTVDSGLDNTTDPVTFTRKSDLLQGPGGGVLTAGDVVDCDGELLEVTGVAGTSITAARGYNGTTPASHADGAVFARMSPGGALTGTGLTTVQGRISGLSDDPILQSMAMPSALVEASEEGELGGDTCRIDGHCGAIGVSVVRGGAYVLVTGERAYSGFCLRTSGQGPSVGFRAAFTLVDC